MCLILDDSLRSVTAGDIGNILPVPEYTLLSSLFYVARYREKQAVQPTSLIDESGQCACDPGNGCY